MRVPFRYPRAARLIAEHEAITIQQEGLRAQNNSQNTILQKLIRGAIETSQRDCQAPVSYTHLTLPTSDLV